MSAKIITVNITLIDETVGSLCLPTQILKEHFSDMSAALWLVNSHIKNQALAYVNRSGFVSMDVEVLIDGTTFMTSKISLLNI
jgi:hypothetical protein